MRFVSNGPIEEMYDVFLNVIVKADKMSVAQAAAFDFRIYVLEFILTIFKMFIKLQVGFPVVCAFMDDIAIITERMACLKDLANGEDWVWTCVYKCV